MSLERAEAYKVSFEWSNPGHQSHIAVSGGRVLCTGSKPKYSYAVGKQKLIPRGKFYWEISLDAGVNFKIGVIKASSGMGSNIDIKDTFMLSSRGVIQSATFEKGEDTLQKYCAGDVVGVFWDGEKGTMTYFVNSNKTGTLFMSTSFKKETFLPVVCLLAEGELLSLQ